MGKWVTARYAAELAEIQARYREWEIFGTREVREVQDPSAYFHPYLRRPTLRPNGNNRPN